MEMEVDRVEGSNQTLQERLRNLEQLEDQVLRILDLTQQSTALLQAPDATLNCDYALLQSLSEEYSNTVLEVHENLMQHGKVLVRPVQEGAKQASAALTFQDEIHDIRDVIQDLIETKLHPGLQQSSLSQDVAKK